MNPTELGKPAAAGSIEAHWWRAAGPAPGPAARGRRGWRRPAVPALIARPAGPWPSSSAESWSTTGRARRQRRTQRSRRSARRWSRSPSGACDRRGAAPGRVAAVRRTGCRETGWGCERHSSLQTESASAKRTVRIAAHRRKFAWPGANGSRGRRKQSARTGANVSRETVSVARGMFAPWEGAFVPLGDAGARVGTFAHERGSGITTPLAAPAKTNESTLRGLVRVLCPAQIRPRRDDRVARWVVFGAAAGRSAVAAPRAPPNRQARVTSRRRCTAAGTSQALIPRRGSSLWMSGSFISGREGGL
jgi:hypothetical protein